MYIKFPSKGLNSSFTPTLQELCTYKMTITLKKCDSKIYVFMWSIKYNLC